MIPTGVIRIIWAIAPSAELRDAMLGDFSEEYEAQVRRDGQASARAHSWREALLSLGGTLHRSMPGGNELVATVLPAAIWGYIVAMCASISATILFLTPVVRFVPVPYSTAWLVALGPTALFTAVLGGYEAARVGQRSPLWSALVLGLVIGAVSLRAVALVWFWPALMPLAPACCVTGAVLQLAQAHRRARTFAK
jgi:hypothetical protein